MSKSNFLERFSSCPVYKALVCIPLPQTNLFPTYSPCTICKTSSSRRKGSVGVGHGPERKVSMAASFFLFFQSFVYKWLEQH
jgi:hypothetical protein